MKRRVADQGEIWHVNLAPTSGREQQGMRYVFVMSHQVANKISGVVLIAPITQGGEYSRVAGFAVPLIGSGCHTQGVIIVSQCRTLDFEARGAKFVERVDAVVVSDATMRFLPIVSD